MRVALFGATGMVGQGVLRECLLDPDITEVIAIGRSSTGRQQPKLREIVTPDLYDYSAIAPKLEGIDACLFCLGVSSAGMSEEAYRRITYDITLAAAEALAKRSPGSKFLYISGAGTDSTGRGRSMWARVKGQTENALLAMPLDAYMFRPGFIQPLHGIRSRTTLYRVFYVLATPLLPLLKKLFPSYVTTTEQLGRAMLAVAKHGEPKRILDSADINRVGR